MLLVLIPNQGSSDCDKSIKAAASVLKSKVETKVMVFIPRFEIRDQFDWRAEFAKIPGIEVRGVGKNSSTIVATSEALEELKRVWRDRATLEEAEAPQFGTLKRRPFNRQ
jgi:hypothetical protein